MKKEYQKTTQAFALSIELIKNTVISHPMVNTVISIVLIRVLYN